MVHTTELTVMAIGDVDGGHRRVNRFFGGKVTVIRLSERSDDFGVASARRSPEAAPDGGPSARQTFLFAPPPMVGRVERAFSWLVRNRRLANDFGKLAGNTGCLCCPHLDPACSPAACQGAGPMMEVRTGRRPDLHQLPGERRGCAERGHLERRVYGRPVTGCGFWEIQFAPRPST